MANFWLVTTWGRSWKTLGQLKALLRRNLPLMARDELPDGDQRTFIVSVRDETGQVVLRAALSFVLDYPSQAQE